MTAPVNTAGIARLDISVARHRRDVPPVNGVLLAAMAAERQRLHEILRRAGHQVHATSDHEDALDVVADTRPSLFIVVVDDIQEDITTLKQLAFLKSGWDHEIKVIAVGDYDDAGTADITLLRAPSETDLLQAVESLFPNISTIVVSPDVPPIRPAAIRARATLTPHRDHHQSWRRVCRRVPSIQLW